MNEVGIALIAAGSALAGSFITGWFSRSAARLTLDAQQAARVLELRRQSYARFLEAAEVRLLARRTGEGQGMDRFELQRALGAVVLEGPPQVVGAARRMADSLRREGSPDELEEAREAFVRAAQQALEMA
ncbi:hypothetical protein [Streptomyces orinoci]|uniref:Uncharacterized protein n=1 Tax=Streptomyces orinoci TaxID=67339 RepID=A0ABV3JTQ9_STRON|nr:hypothetical protein [Streptomyces orinoci]